MIDRAIKKGNYERAVAIARRYSRMRPRDPEAWTMWARLLEDRAEGLWGEAAIGGAKATEESLDEAETVLRQGVKGNPQSFELRLALANLLISRFNKGGESAGMDEAETLLKQLQTEQPDSLEASLGLAHLAHNRRDWPEVERLTAPIERRGSFTETPEVMHRLICLLVFVPGNGRERARSLLERAIAVNPRIAIFRALLGVLIEEEDPVAARQLLQEARDLLPSHPWDEELESLRKLYSRWGPEWWGDSE